MADEIERKWLIDSRQLDLSTFRKSGLEVIDIEQGYLPANDVILADAYSCIFVSGLKIDASFYYCNKVKQEICDANGQFPADLEIRWRIENSNRFIITVKGSSSNNGIRRPEIEFLTSSDIVNVAKKMSGIYIKKTRVKIPIATGELEIDFYRDPKFPFVSVEKEFKRYEDAGEFVMPSYIERFHPIDVTSNKVFKNKRLISDPDAARAEWDNIFDGKYVHLLSFPNVDFETIKLYKHWLDIDSYKETMRWKGISKNDYERRESDPEHSIMLAMYEWFGTNYDKSADESNQIRRMEYALDHDFAEYITEDITYEAFAKSSAQERATLHLWKEKSEHSAINLLAAGLPEKVASVKKRVWKDYESQDVCDSDARQVKGDDKVISGYAAEFYGLGKYLSEPKVYINKAIDTVPPPAYFTITAIEELSSFMRPDELAENIYRRNKTLDKLEIDEMRECIKFLRTIFTVQDEERFAQKFRIHKESVGGHTWRLAYMLSTFARAVDMPKGFDFGRAIKMCLVHDLPEIKVGDISHEQVFCGMITKEQKHDLEMATLLDITKKLPAKIREEIIGLWQEYEQTRTPTGTLVRALDKIESTTHVLLQGISYNPEIRGLHGNEYYAKVPALWPMVEILKYQLKSDYMVKGYKWKPEFDNWHPVICKKLVKELER